MPAVTLAASGYWLVTNEIKRQAGVQLSQASKISGTLVLARLHTAATDLDAVVATIEAGHGSLDPEASLRSVTADDGTPKSLWGDLPTRRPPLSPQAQQQLQRGRAAIIVGGHAPRPAVYLVRRVVSRSRATDLWAEIDGTFLWGDREAESVAPPGTEFCVYAAHGLPLHCSSPAASVGRMNADPSASDITGSSSIFLGFEYSAAPWQVVLMQPGVTMQAAGEFRRSVLLTLLAGLGLVVLASNILLRKSLDPVMRLREGTRRVASGDFSVPVQVTTGDEFEDLAHSFNSMATGLKDTLQRLNAMSLGTLEALARTIDANSPWTAGHSERVTRVGMAIGRQMGLPEEEIDRIHRGGLLHDVGKIGIPGSVLDKPGALDPEELAIVRSHPVVGARILEPVNAHEDVIGMVRHHHERYDGDGYPDGLAGERIPFLARILAVADVYDALVSDRPYRSGWTSDLAIRHISERAGSHFDPDVVGAFLELVESEDWAAVVGADGPDARMPFAQLRTV